MCRGDTNRHVSIHAPTWGATQKRTEKTPLKTRFNPRAHMGRDCRNLGYFRVFIEFQSTRPHGARPRRTTGTFCRFCFNPRAHMGRDVTRGGCQPSNRRFNPRAHMGRDQSNRCYKIAFLVSIHAPTWGATCHCDRPDNRLRFQSTRPHGARRWWRPRSPWPFCFNPRAHMGRDVCPFFIILKF